LIAILYAPFVLTKRKSSTRRNNSRLFGERPGVYDTSCTITVCETAELPPPLWRSPWKQPTPVMLSTPGLLLTADGHHTPSLAWWHPFPTQHPRGRPLSVLFLVARLMLRRSRFVIKDH
jgi:hypothetical protein